MRTSASDDGLYPLFCKKAATDDNAFRTFKRDPIYTTILEHVSEDQGQQYLNEIKKDTDIYSKIELFKENDLYGHPCTSFYDLIGSISPTTLRYTKVLKDLKDIFGNLETTNICEIGVGYGGLCRIISEYFCIKSYTLVDLPEVLLLAEKFLSKYNTRCSLSFKEERDLNIAYYDMVISNYAFSELTKEVQDKYLEKIILNSKCGYMTYNNAKIPNYSIYSINEILNIIPKSKVLPEVPLTAPDNKIIVWGNK